MLTLYCLCHTRWRQAEDHLEVEGEIVGDALNPWFHVSATAGEQLDQLSDRLGLSPLGRAVG